MVHALAAVWAEPGGSSVTVLTRILGLRRAKTRVNLGRHRRTPVPSLSQKSHLPPAFPCPRSLQAYPVREGSSRDAPAPQYPDSRCTTTCWVQSTPVASISHTHLSPPAFLAPHVPTPLPENTLIRADPHGTHQKDQESHHRSQPYRGEWFQLPSPSAEQEAQGKKELSRDASPSLASPALLQAWPWTHELIRSNQPAHHE